MDTLPQEKAKVATAEEITEYYRKLPTEGPPLPDETKTHVFKKLMAGDVVVEPSS